jgi:hypothetical protein
MAKILDHISPQDQERHVESGLSWAEVSGNLFGGVASNLMEETEHIRPNYPEAQSNPAFLPLDAFPDV